MRDSYGAGAATPPVDPSAAGRDPELTEAERLARAELRSQMLITATARTLCVGRRVPPLRERQEEAEIWERIWTLAGALGFPAALLLRNAARGAGLDDLGPTSLAELATWLGVLPGEDARKRVTDVGRLTEALARIRIDLAFLAAEADRLGRPDPPAPLPAGSDP